jgi:hypothetical protein
MSDADAGEREARPLVRLPGEVETPPVSREAGVEAGVLLRRPRRGEAIGMPHPRPLPSIGPRRHALRINDRGRAWRIVDRVDAGAIVIVEVFGKATRATPRAVIGRCQARLRDFDRGDGP